MAEEEKKEEGEEEVKEVGRELQLVETSNQAIALAYNFLDEWDRAIVRDEVKRQKFTKATGAVMGTVINTYFDAKVEDDPDIRAELLEHAGLSSFEILGSALAGLLAGERRRRDIKKKGKKE